MSTETNYQAYQQANREAQQRALATGQPQELTQQMIEQAAQNHKAPEKQEVNQQAQQKVAAEAFQIEQNQAQQRALATGQPQEVTKEAVRAQEQNLLDTKYSQGVPIVPQAAQARATQANYEIFKANQIIEASNRGVPSAYRLTPNEVSDIRANTGVQNILSYSKPEGGDDFAMFAPASGFRKVNVAEGYDAFGQKQTAIIRLEPITPKEQKEYYLPNPTVPFDIREGSAPSIKVDVETGMPIPTKDVFTEFGLGIRDTAQGYADLITGKPSSYNVASKAQNALFRESSVAREKGVIGFDIDVEAFPKILGEAAKNPARAVGQVYGDVVLGLFGSEGLGKAAGAGAKGVSKIVGSVRDSGIIKSIQGGVESSAAVIKRDAVKFVNPDISPDLSGFTNVKVSLGKSLVSSRPLFKEAFAEPFSNTSVNLGTGAVKQTPLKPFQNVTIDLGTTRASGVAEKGLKFNQPRPVKPEDFGFKETKGSDGTTQLVKQVTDQATKQEVKTTPRLFQNTSIALGMGAVTTEKIKPIQTLATSSRQNAIPALSQSNKTDVSKLLGFGGQTGAERTKIRANIIPDFDLGFNITTKGSEQIKPVSQSGLIGKTGIGSLLGTGAKSTQGFKFENTPIQIPKQTPFLGTKTPSTFKFDIPTGMRLDIPNPRPPKIPSLDTEPPFKDILDFPGPSKKKKTKGARKKKGKAQKRTFYTTNPLTAVLGVDTSIGKAIQRFGDLT